MNKKIILSLLISGLILTVGCGKNAETEKDNEPQQSSTTTSSVTTNSTTTTTVNSLTDKKETTKTTTKSTTTKSSKKTANSQKQIRPKKSTTTKRVANTTTQSTYTIVQTQPPRSETTTAAPKSSPTPKISKNTTSTTAKVKPKATTAQTSSKPKVQVSGTAMYISESCAMNSIVNGDWGTITTWLKRGDKVIAYDTIKPKCNRYAPITKIKYGDKIGYVDPSLLTKDNPNTSTKLKQSDINKLVKEMQAYSDKKAYSFAKKVYKLNGYSSPEKFLSDIKWMTPENSSWTPTEYIYTNYTFNEAKTIIKKAIDANYTSIKNDAQIVVYARWCPSGNGCTDEYQTKDGWEIYCLV